MPGCGRRRARPAPRSRRPEGSRPVPRARAGRATHRRRPIVRDDRAWTGRAPAVHGPCATDARTSDAHAVHITCDPGGAADHARAAAPIPTAGPVATAWAGAVATARAQRPATRPPAAANPSGTCAPGPTSGRAAHGERPILRSDHGGNDLPDVAPRRQGPVPTPGALAHDTCAMRPPCVRVRRRRGRRGASSRASGACHGPRSAHTVPPVNVTHRTGV